MRRGICTGLAVGMLVVTGCAPGDLDGRLGFGGDTSPLQRILFTSEHTPAYQGLLYAAMKDAEAATQAAGHAVAAAEDPAEVKEAMGEVIYAVAPEVAPDWRAKRAGLVPGWRATGYGVRRAVREMGAELGALEGDAPARALVCVENTAQRAERLLDLARRALETGGPDGQGDLLARIEDLAVALKEGRDADGDEVIAIEAGECGLQAVRTILEGLRVRRTAV